MELSKKAMSIKPSTTMAISSRAAEMKAAGVDVVSFGAGNPILIPLHTSRRQALMPFRTGRHAIPLRQGHRS